MINLKPLWLFQQSKIDLDSFEKSMKETENFIQFNKISKFMQSQKRTLQSLTKAEINKQEKIIEQEKKVAAIEQLYKTGIEKFNASPKDDLAEIAKFKKYFEQLGTQLIQEKKEVAALVKQLQKEDEWLTTMKTKLAKASKEFDILKKAVEEERALVQDKLTILKTNLDEQKSKVPKELMQEYLNTKKSFEVPIARVENNKCMGCNMELPAIVSRKLKDSVEVAECESCGRLLYLEVE